MEVHIQQQDNETRVYRTEQETLQVRCTALGIDIHVPEQPTNIAFVPRTNLQQFVDAFNNDTSLEIGDYVCRIQRNNKLGLYRVDTY